MWLRALLFFGSIVLNISLLWNHNYFDLSGNSIQEKLSWSKSAAAEAEAVAAVDCSGHGRAYLDGIFDEGKGNHVCECNACYQGSDCSQFLPDCAADADSCCACGTESTPNWRFVGAPKWKKHGDVRSPMWHPFIEKLCPLTGNYAALSRTNGDPLFLEPFWMQHAASSAVLVTGWHRMSYSFPDKTSISQELEKHIRRLHAIAKNAMTDDKYIIFGGGSTQLLGAAVYALSTNLSSPASVVAASPFYPLYKSQTDYFQTVRFEFEGDASSLKNYSDNVIEFVTSPNNPDGNLRRPASTGAPIYDHAYYWPHFTAIPAPSDQDLMIFTISKLTGHAGSRFGWAFVKDEEVYKRMTTYISLAEMGISREAQLRALQLVKAILQNDNGSEFFDFGFSKMRDRWRRLNDVVSLSTRFTLQKVPVRFCNFFQKLREPSPAYGWLKCEREEDVNCVSVLQAANIIGRAGSLFNAEDRYVRLSLLKSDDDFDLLVYRLRQLLVAEGNGPKTI